MHIPGGFLSGQTCWVTNLFSCSILGYFITGLKELKDKSRLVFYALTAAMIFALQMLNFPILNGTSGHFVGAALAMFAAGPYIGSLIMAVVLAVQALFFNDGGIMALGSNILCMSLVAVWVPYLIQKTTRINKYLMIIAASWFSVASAALVCSLLLAISGTVPLFKVLPAMLGYHALIGIGEAVITTVVYFVFVDEQALLRTSNILSSKVSLVYGFMALILATLVSPLASSHPDGLERAGEILGFISKGVQESIFISPLADYSVPHMVSGAMSTGTAGLIGTILSFILAAGFFLMIRNYYKKYVVQA